MVNNDSLNNKKTCLLTKINEIIVLKENTKIYIIDSYENNYYYLYDKSQFKTLVNNILYFIDNIYKGKYEEIIIFINE